MQHSEIYLSSWYEDAVRKLTSSETPKLDVSLFITEVTGLTATQQRYQDILLSNTQQDKLNKLLIRRQQGEPVAYILGYQPFYDINLRVTPATLIPRPETEHLVDKALDIIPVDEAYAIADLGTGSGAIAIAIAKHRPQARVIAVDKSVEALKIAQENAQNNSVHNIQFVCANWTDALKNANFQIIISNPPYVAPNDEHLALLQYEPITALAAQQDGYADLFYLLQNANVALLKKGHLLIEHGYSQAKSLFQFAQECDHWRSIDTEKDYAGNDRITILQKR